MIVALGQATWYWQLGVVSALAGYAMFWVSTIDLVSTKKRFILATLWYTSIQMVQLSWFLSHPYSYIYAVWILLSLGMGAQFGWLTLLVTRRRVQSIPSCLGVAALWVVFEWLRLFVLAGLSLNPSGMALASTTYGLQMASLIGVYGLSFWVILANLFAARFAFAPNLRGVFFYGTVALFPYIFGIAHIAYHENTPWKEGAKTLLVQTHFPAEETLGHKSMQESVTHTFGEWVHILTLLKPHLGKSFDVVALPEAVVPFGTYYPIFRYDEVLEAFETFMGKETLQFIPKPNQYLSMKVDTEMGPVMMVNNAFWAQAITDLFNAPLVAGLEDFDGDKAFLSAFTFYPHSTANTRYDKRVLLPMAEYIPSAWMRSLAAKYGVHGSFTHGNTACVIPTKGGNAGLSICYEETFGDLMRENKLLGADYLVNITSDIWYPNSKLPIQHLEHARLRTVEMGLPLVRACNTGATGGIDCLGRTLTILQTPDGDVENISEAFEVQVSSYHYFPLYARFGDSLILAISALCLAIMVYYERYVLTQIATQSCQLKLR